MCWRWRCWAATIEVVVWAVDWATMWVLIPWHIESLTPLSVSLLEILARWVVVEVTATTWLLAWLWRSHLYLYKASVTVESYNETTWLAVCITC